MKQSEIEKLPYRPCVGMMLINKAGEVFIAQRIDSIAEAWQMPQGGIDEGESPADAAMRELGEEVGTTNAVILAESRDWHNYDLPLNLVPKLWGGRFRGQRQKWFALRFKGSDSEINIETSEPEFTTWRWSPLDQLGGLIVPFKQKIYRQISKEFGHLAIPDKN